MDVTTVVELKPEMRIEGVEELKNEFVEALAGATAGIRIDGKDNESCDTAALQLLVAFVRAADNRQVPVSWSNPSESIVNAAMALDLGEELGLTEKVEEGA